MPVPNRMHNIRSMRKMFLARLNKVLKRTVFVGLHDRGEAVHISVNRSLSQKRRDLILRKRQRAIRHDHGPRRRAGSEQCPRCDGDHATDAMQQPGPYPLDRRVIASGLDGRHAIYPAYVHRSWISILQFAPPVSNAPTLIVPLLVTLARHCPQSFQRVGIQQPIGYNPLRKAAGGHDGPAGNDPSAGLRCPIPIGGQGAGPRLDARLVQFATGHLKGGSHTLRCFYGVLN
jgi:hypothetical protein